MHFLCYAHKFVQLCFLENFNLKRAIFQLFQPEDFQVEGAFHPLNMSKDDSFINPFIKIRMPDAFDPTMFLRTPYQSQTVPTNSDPSYLLEQNIETLQANMDTLEANIENLNNIDNDVEGNTYLEPNDGLQSEEQIQSIINKNIEYLKNDNLQEKTSSFPTNTVASRFMSPVDRLLNSEACRSRVQSPFEKHPGFIDDTLLGFGSYAYPSNPAEKHPGFMDDTHLGYHTGSYSYAFNQYIPPDPVGLEPAQMFSSKDNRFVDYGKKDPFLGDVNYEVGQLNVKDPFLIQADISQSVSKQCETIPSYVKPSASRSCKDFPLNMTSNLPPQGTNIVNFSSILDEPTQLDYLDLATLDFITNPNLIPQSFSSTSSMFKTSFEKDDDMYSEDNLVYHEQASVYTETIARLEGNLGNRNSFEEPAKYSNDKLKPVRLKKCKSDLGKSSQDSRYSSSNMMSKGLAEIPSFGLKRELCIRKKSPSRAEKGGRKRKMSESNIDGYRAMNNKQKLNRKRLCKSGKIFNVRETLTFLTEEQKDKMKAVIGKDCIFVKKQIDNNKEPIVVVEDIPISFKSLFNTSHSPDKHTLVKSKTITDNSTLNETTSICSQHSQECKKLTSVLVLKCKECDFTCSSGQELKDHCQAHKSETELAAESICENEDNGFVYEEPMISGAKCDEGALTKLIDELTESAVNDCVEGITYNPKKDNQDTAENNTIQTLLTGAEVSNEMTSVETSDKENVSHDTTTVEDQTSLDCSRNGDIVFKIPYSEETAFDIPKEICGHNACLPKLGTDSSPSKSSVSSSEKQFDVEGITEMLGFELGKDSTLEYIDTMATKQEQPEDILSIAVATLKDYTTAPTSDNDPSSQNDIPGTDSCTNFDLITTDNGVCGNGYEKFDEVDTEKLASYGNIPVELKHNFEKNETYEFLGNANETCIANTVISSVDTTCKVTESIHCDKSHKSDIHLVNSDVVSNLQLSGKMSLFVSVNVQRDSSVSNQRLRRWSWTEASDFSCVQQKAENSDHSYFSNKEKETPSKSQQIPSLPGTGIQFSSNSPVKTDEDIIVDGNAFDIPDALSHGSVTAGNFSHGHNSNSTNTCQTNTYCIPKQPILLRKDATSKITKTVIKIPKQLFAPSASDTKENTGSETQYVSILSEHRDRTTSTEAGGNQDSKTTGNHTHLPGRVHVLIL